MGTYWQFIEVAAVIGIFVVGYLEVSKSMANRSIQGRMMGFVEDLFDDKCPEDIPELLEKWKVSRNEFGYWLKDKRFIEEIKIRLRWRKRNGEIFLAKYSIAAAARLVNLTNSRNTETARRACVDVLNLLRERHRPGRPGRPKKEEFPQIPKTESLTNEQASALLETLARHPFRRENDNLPGKRPA